MGLFGRLVYPHSRSAALGLRLEDLDGAHRQVFIAEGKGGHQRRIPISGRFFVTVGDYLRVERPADASSPTRRRENLA